MDRVITLLVVVLSAAAVSWLVVGAADRTVSVLSRRRADRTVWDLLHRCRLSLGITLFTALLLGASPTAREPLGDAYDSVRHVVLLVLIAAVSWLVARIITVLATASFNRYAASASDRSRVRRVGTRLAMVRRVTVVVITVVAIATMLLTFPGVRAVGASMLASAGVIGIVAGVAAQSSLSNLFAGIQIAFSDMVRIGDVVVVDQQYGTVEEITLSYIVITTWDEKRIVMPVSYFATKPYENWTRGDARMTGTVFLHLDHRTPVPELREHLRLLLEDSALWDKRAWSLVVTDTTPSTIQVRALVSARDADDLFTLRCLVRERLIEYVVREHPYALPRVTTGPSDGPSEGRPEAAEQAERPPGHGAEEDAAGPPARGVRLAREQDRERDRERDARRAGPAGF